MKENKKKKLNPFLFFIFAVVIPLIIVGVITVVILSIAGFDTFGWMKEKGSTMPVVSSFVMSKEDEEIENKLGKANETIELQKEEMNELTNEIASMEGIIDELEMEIKRLENRTVDDENDNENDAEINDEVKQASASFRKMDPEKAATIIQNLDKNMAVQILSKLSGDVRGNILAEMEPKNAAELTEEMMK
ncbi:MAG TPA: hypothetical protein VK085_13820 [Pseudogracilibacillus sp.]|nr:hypothetical protein [Pseudogracilibacillus sp.]